MPLLDIAIAQSSFHTLGAQTVIRGEFILFGNDKRSISTWKSFQIPKKARDLKLGHTETHKRRLLISAIATLEQKYAVPSNESHHNLQSVYEQKSHQRPPQFSSEDLEEVEVEEREQLRRLRISKANKGNTPWNKGRKHSAETLQRIKERTRLAMQNPKVKMKLINLGHAQTKETRKKIAVGVRVGWERRREKLTIQESCHFDWQNLIAEASRVGFVGEGDFQWDTYRILDKQFELEWLESVEKRKEMARPKGGKKGPKSPEQRRKISEAISAKWADPGYRDRVFSALSKYHGTPVGVPRKAKIKSVDDRITIKRRQVKNKVNDFAANEAKTQIQRPRLRKTKVPLYKDPLAGSKLEMIKNIRAQRASAGTKKTEAIERAKLLIAEAEKASNALEVAAKKSPFAQASLIKTRKLIAEAIQSIESIGTEQCYPHENGRNPSFSSVGLANDVGEQKEVEIEGQSKTEHKKINASLKDVDFGKFTFQDLFSDGKDELLLLPASFSDFDPLNRSNIGKLSETGFGNCGLVPSELNNVMKQSSFRRQRQGKLQIIGSDREEKKPSLSNRECMEKESSSDSIVVTKKKWVRGKLVELADEDSD